MAWGRAVVGGAGAGAGGGGGGEGNKGGVNGEASASKESRRINVLATGSVDQTIKVGPCFFFFFNSYVSSTQGTPDRSGHPSKTLKLLLLYLYIKRRIYRHYTSRRDFTTISIMRYAPSINMLI